MVTFTELEQSAMQLPDDQRAKLAETFLGSLPPVLQSDDDGVSEALRRDAELDADPSKGISLNEFRASFEK